MAMTSLGDSFFSSIIFLWNYCHMCWLKHVMKHGARLYDRKYCWFFENLATEFDHSWPCPLLPHWFMTPRFLKYNSQNTFFYHYVFILSIHRQSLYYLENISFMVFTILGMIFILGFINQILLKEIHSTSQWGKQIWHAEFPYRTVQNVRVIL